MCEHFTMGLNRINSQEKWRTRQKQNKKNTEGI
jgi:hypothetical protein